MNEARYSRLTREFPERAAELFERNEQGCHGALQASGEAHRRPTPRSKRFFFPGVVRTVEDRGEVAKAASPFFVRFRLLRSVGA